MNRTLRLAMIFFILFSVLLSACTGSSSAEERESPVRLEDIEGTDMHRVVLTERAAERLGIQTTLVTDQVVARTWTVGGEVVMPQIASATISAPVDGTVFTTPDTPVLSPGTQLTEGQVILHMLPAASGGDIDSVVDVKVTGDSVLLRMIVTPGQVVEEGQALFEVANLEDAWVRVSLNKSDLASVDRSSPARILSLKDDDDDDNDDDEFEVEALGDIEEDDDADESTLYYVLNDAGHSMARGQRVMVELTLSGSGVTRQIVPYSAVIYDLQGNTWVYISPEPLVFIRQPVTIDYIAGDMAVLLEGPPTGTAVVIVGVAELYGADTGVGK